MARNRVLARGSRPSILTQIAQGLEGAAPAIAEGIKQRNELARTRQRKAQTISTIAELLGAAGPVSSAISGPAALEGAGAQATSPAQGASAVIPGTRLKMEDLLGGLNDLTPANVEKISAGLFEDLLESALVPDAPDPTTLARNIDAFIAERDKGDGADPDRLKAFEKALFPAKEKTSIRDAGFNADGKALFSTFNADGDLLKTVVSPVVGRTAKDTFIGSQFVAAGALALQGGELPAGVTPSVAAAITGLLEKPDGRQRLQEAMRATQLATTEVFTTDADGNVMVIRTTGNASDVIADVGKKQAARSLAQRRQEAATEHALTLQGVLTITNAIQQAQALPPESFGIRGQFGQSVSGLLGQFTTGETSEAISRALTGVSQGDLSRKQLAAAAVVASSIPELRGEESGRVSNEEFEFAKQVTRALAATADKEQFLAALGELQGLRLIRSDRLRLEAGLPPRFDLNTDDEIELALSKLQALGIGDEKSRFRFLSLIISLRENFGKGLL